MQGRAGGTARQKGVCKTALFLHKTQPAVPRRGGGYFRSLERTRSCTTHQYSAHRRAPIYVYHSSDRLPRLVSFGCQALYREHLGGNRVVNNRGRLYELNPENTTHEESLPCAQSLPLIQGNDGEATTRDECSGDGGLCKNSGPKSYRG